MGYITVFGILIVYTVVSSLLWLPYIATLKLGSIGLRSVKRLTLNSPSEKDKKKKARKKKLLKNKIKKKTSFSRFKVFFQGLILIFRNKNPNEAIKQTKSNENEIETASSTGKTFKYCLNQYYINS